MLALRAVDSVRLVLESECFVIFCLRCSSDFFDTGYVGDIDFRGKLMELFMPHDSFL